MRFPTKIGNAAFHVLRLIRRNVLPQYADLHLTYRCNLACGNCNRLCYLPPATPDMTMDDVSDFVDQCVKIGWNPVVGITGGEPTLHPQFLEIIKFLPFRLRIYSNGHSDRTNEILAQAPRGEIFNEHKAHSVSLPNYPGSRPCKWMPGIWSCGICVDHEGYAFCSCGGAIDGHHKLGLRTKRLADMFDPDFVEHQLAGLCAHCGPAARSGSETKARPTHAVA